MNKKVPDMGLISLDPKILLNYIYQGGWIYEKGNGTFTIYNGTRDGESKSKFVEKYLIGTLMTYNFITVDSGNWDFHETYYRFNQDYDASNKSKNIELLDILKTQIKKTNYKNKYKHLIRQHKLERIEK